ncbi:MAG: Gfo/Idh/MocA family oxidoreductase [Armatimonadetes bacterium]|nr:Gfo/Idh/MocA family oxidoreductase [Armatimonadota bacterium]
MVRIAMLSFAHVHANGYADQVMREPNAEMVAVWDDMPERGKVPAEKYGVPFVHDLDELLSRDDVDAVVVNAETSKHREVMVPAARAKKHIFTEKALSVTMEDSRAIAEVVRDAGIVFTISLPSRTSPNFLFMKEALEKNWLGDVTQARMRNAHSAALDHWFSGGTAWFGDKELAGGGSLFDLGCHQVDMMRALLGPPKQVTALAANYSHAYDIDDICIAIIEFENKALGIIDVSWIQRSGPNTNEIYGTEGFVGTGYPGAGAFIQSRKLNPEGITGTIQPNLPKAHPSLMSQWLARIEGSGGEPDTNIEDGVNLTELLQGIYASADSGKAHQF